METARAALTVLFEPPFWVGVFERESGGRYEACRVVFGAEPRDFEVYAYVLDRHHRLTEAQRRRQLRQAKRKEKHRGR